MLKETHQNATVVTAASHTERVPSKEFLKFARCCFTTQRIHVWASYNT